MNTVAEDLLYEACELLEAAAAKFHAAARIIRNDRPLLAEDLAACAVRVESERDRVPSIPREEEQP